MTGLEIMGAVAAVAGAFGLGLSCWVYGIQKREIERLRLLLEADQTQDDQSAEDLRNARALANAWFDLAVGRGRTLEAIAAATAGINHGTARRLRRIAREAIDG